MQKELNETALEAPQHLLLPTIPEARGGSEDGGKSPAPRGGFSSEADGESESSDAPGGGTIHRVGSRRLQIISVADHETVVDEMDSTLESFPEGVPRGEGQESTDSNSEDGRGMTSGIGQTPDDMIDSAENRFRRKSARKMAGARNPFSIPRNPKK